MVNHFDGRRLHRRMFTQEVRALIVGRKHDGVAIRQFVKQYRERLAAPAGFAAEPGGHNRRRLLLLRIR